MTGRDCLRYMHKNAALINRGRIGHLIGHLIGLGTAHEFLRERIRGPCACTYAVITLVPWLYLLHEASGCRTPRHRMPIASRIFPIFHLLSTLSPPPPPPLPSLYLSITPGKPRRVPFTLRFLLILFRVSFTLASVRGTRLRSFIFHNRQRNYYKSPRAGIGIVERFCRTTVRYRYPIDVVKLAMHLAAIGGGRRGSELS